MFPASFIIRQTPPPQLEKKPKDQPQWNGDSEYICKMEYYNDIQTMDNVDDCHVVWKRDIKEYLL